MRKHKWLRWVAACLVIVILIGSVAAATLNYDLNGDGKTNIWDLQMALNGGVSEADQKAALNEALGGGDELHKNAEGQWEIWTTLGLYNMAKNAQSGDTFVLMQDIDMEGAGWTPVENFSGNAIYISGVGTENTVTCIKNGTLNHGVIGVRVDTGSIDLSNVTINGVGSCGSSVAFYDPDGTYRANNKIDGCYFYNPNYTCISWNVADVDFSGTGVLLSNSTLIAAKNYVFGQLTDRMSGVNELGENLSLYSNKTVLGNKTFPRYSGLQANLTETTSVTVDGTTITGLKNWSTAYEKDTVNVLLLGNSLSTTLPEELYQLAEADGYEVVVTDLYHAGACGWQHKEWIENDMEEYEYRVYNDMGFWMHGDIKTVSDAIPYMDWDHVSYQEWFQKNKNDGITPLTDFTFKNACALFESYNDWIYDYLQTNLPDSVIYCYQHWSWQVGHGHVPDTATQTQMYEMIQQTTEYFSEKYSVPLIPCGDAIQLARADESIGDVLCYPDDKVHCYEPTGGQYLIGCVFYETMFQESCIGNTWRKNATSYPSEETQLLLQQYAHQVVAAVHGDSYAK